MWKRRVLVSLAVLLVLVTAGGVGIWRSAQPPDIPEFYDPPALPEGATAGQILRTEEVDAPVAGARLWRMLYTSTDLAGAIVPVSARVAVPAASEPDGGYPLVAVGHGTVGIARGCAPSIDPFADADASHTLYEFTLGHFVEAGYATVMADYLGLGAPGDNSYLIGEIEGRTILDSVRAMQAFPDIAVQPGILLTGQSQGGHAALFAGQLAQDYAPEIDVLGVAALAPARSRGGLSRRTGRERAGRRGVTSRHGG